VRYTGFAFSFNTANALLGGTIPLLATWLIHSTGSTLAPNHCDCVFIFLFPITNLQRSHPRGLDRDKFRFIALNQYAHAK
jgi:MFS transporter, MHS family, proline/betaine transporter